MVISGLEDYFLNALGCSWRENLSERREPTFCFSAVLAAAGRSEKLHPVHVWADFGEKVLDNLHLSGLVSILRVFPL